VKKELRFDSLRKKTPTKETHPYSRLVQVDNGGGVGGCGWDVNRRWGKGACVRIWKMPFLSRIEGK